MKPFELKSYRQQLGVSQTRLSHLTGISRFRISQFESEYLTLREGELNIIRQALKALASQMPTFEGGVE